MNESRPLSLFTGFGVELEYMIVKRDSLDVYPITDKVIQAVTGEYVSDVELDDIAWSNELVLHVIELKTNGPAAALQGLATKFTDHGGRINRLLEPLGGRLLPTGMHPWMNPLTETQLWPHEFNAVYEAFDRIFHCQGHGWSNLQSLHLNLPFENDKEFARLHAAIRLLMPIMPALAASSPVMDGNLTGRLDNRLEVYRHNSKKIPLVSGKVIPEPVFSQQDYEAEILQKLYHAIAPHDPDKVLQYEWLNARGAIARFDRNTIEIRVIDVQECPQADLAIAHALIAVLRALTEERWQPLADQQDWPVDPLASILLTTIADAEQAVIDNRAYLESFGFPATSKCTAGELWQHLIETAVPDDPEWRQALQVMMMQGPLARRLLKALGKTPARSQMFEVYAELCECLTQNRMFVV